MRRGDQPQMIKTAKTAVFLALGLLAAAAPAAADPVATRFGVMDYDDNARLLTYQGKPVRNAEPNNGFNLYGPKAAGAYDLVMVENMGGSFCPAQYRVAVLSSAGLKLSPEFGTCSDLMDSHFDGQKLKMVQPDMKTGEPVLFVLDPATASVTRNGKPVK